VVLKDFCRQPIVTNHMGLVHLRVSVPVENPFHSLYLLDNMGVFDLSEGSHILGRDPEFENPRWVKTVVNLPVQE